MSTILIRPTRGLASLGLRARIAHRPRRAGDQLRTHANIAKARRILGYTPHTSAADGLAQEVAWLRGIMNL